MTLGPLMKRLWLSKWCLWILSLPVDDLSQAGLRCSAACWGGGLKVRGCGRTPSCLRTGVYEWSKRGSERDHRILWKHETSGGFRAAPSHRRTRLPHLCGFRHSHAPSQRHALAFISFFSILALSVCSVKGEQIGREMSVVPSSRTNGRSGIIVKSLVFHQTRIKWTLSTHSLAQFRFLNTH